jgi:menaquinone-dependent protoporphyrinogen oxidase
MPKRWRQDHRPSCRSSGSAAARPESAAGAGEHRFNEFLHGTGWQPAITQDVAGAYAKYNWINRWLMKRIVGKAGGDTDTSRD